MRAGWLTIEIGPQALARNPGSLLDGDNVAIGDGCPFFDGLSGDAEQFCQFAGAPGTFDGGFESFVHCPNIRRATFPCNSVWAILCCLLPVGCVGTQALGLTRHFGAGMGVCQVHMTPEEYGAFLHEGAAKANTDPLTFLNSTIAYDQMRKERQQSEVQSKQVVHAARAEAEPKLAEFYRVNSESLMNGRFDPHELVGRVGLDNTQGNRMWLSRKLLEYRKADEYRRQGASECKAA